MFLFIDSISPEFQVACPFDFVAREKKVNPQNCVHKFLWQGKREREREREVALRCLRVWVCFPYVTCVIWCSVNHVGEVRHITVSLVQVTPFAVVV